MNRAIHQAALVLACSSVLICSSCGGSSPSPSSSGYQSSSSSSSSRNGAYMICYTTSSAHGITVSSVFHVAAADSVTMLEEPWAKDFRRYIGQSGDEGGISVTCTQADPKNPDAALKDKIDEWRKQGLQVKQVNWKYAGG